MSDREDIQIRRNRTIKEIEERRLLPDFDMTKIDRLGGDVRVKAKPEPFTLPRRPKKARRPAPRRARAERS